MWDDFAYLISNRERPDTVIRWFVLLIKRTLLFFPLLIILFRPLWLRMRGAKIGRLVVLGKSKMIGALSNLRVGDEVSLGRCEVSLHDVVRIGRRAVINDGAKLLTASHDLTDPKWKHIKAPIEIGDYAWIATNAIVLPGTRIGKGAVIGAGAVVKGEVPDFVVVSGNPARHHGARRVETLDYSPVLLTAPFQAGVGTR